MFGCIHGPVYTDCPMKRLPSIRRFFIGLFWLKIVMPGWVEISAITLLSHTSVSMIFLAFCSPIICSEHLLVLRSYWLPANWALHFWGMFNSLLLPASCTRWATTSFGRCSFAGHIKQVAATWQRFIHFDLQVTQELNPCYGNSWFCHGGSHAESPSVPEIADTRWTPMVYHGCCCHIESITCCFKQADIRIANARYFKHCAA